VVVSGGGRGAVEVPRDGSVLVAVLGILVVAATVRGLLLLLLLAITIVFLCVVWVAPIGWSVG
jgi:hypothetical protein